MKSENRYLYQDGERISSTLSQQAAAEARWLAGARGCGKRPTAREQRDQRIRELAYFRAQRRGFVPGFEVQDWLAAEEEIDSAFRDYQ